MSPVAVSRPRLRLEPAEAPRGRLGPIPVILGLLGLLWLVAWGSYKIGQGMLYQRVLDYRLAVDSTARMGQGLIR